MASKSTKSISSLDPENGSVKDSTTRRPPDVQHNNDPAQQATNPMLTRWVYETRLEELPLVDRMLQKNAGTQKKKESRGESRS
ncbi:uncharacterized protein UV8b_05597 [Ustilaginoidea virens]|uniref:Uncharacterized protein n=1 Tax=Ustilaginoidea virens TaxID=1159556 RepID=A0A063BLB5_USTVR|nr:uncharacterized protein UV8b_05597 [Ustilaginoidea virens]QUC21354.1 hypothetical protein UV8b_05597 [Ustilaginoidea virens]GAO16191.1 hypothetical protein UVI_02045160 [Ustilaginoidea virens]